MAYGKKSGGRVKGQPDNKQRAVLASSLSKGRDALAKCVDENKRRELENYLVCLEQSYHLNQDKVIPSPLSELDCAQEYVTRFNNNVAGNLKSKDKTGRDIKRIIIDHVTHEVNRLVIGVDPTINLDDEMEDAAASNPTKSQIVRRAEKRSAAEEAKQEAVQFAESLKSLKPDEMSSKENQDKLQELTKIAKEKDSKTTRGRKRAQSAVGGATIAEWYDKGLSVLQQTYVPKNDTTHDDDAKVLNLWKTALARHRQKKRKMP